MFSVYGIAATIIVFFIVGLAVDNIFGGGHGIFVFVFIILAVISVFYKAYRALNRIEGPGGIKKH